MAKDDYYVLVYRILTYLYNQLKAGEPVDVSKLTPEWLGIPRSYFEFIFETLSEEGYVRDVAFDDMMDGRTMSEDIKISPAGISFLHNNSTIQKVKNSIKGIADIVGNIPLL
jgi:hypothetical protein